MFNFTCIWFFCFVTVIFLCLLLSYINYIFFFKNPHNSGYLNIKIGKGKITYGYIPLTISESVGQQSSALRKMDTFQ